MCKIHLCSFLLLAVNGLLYPLKILKLYPIITCYTFKKSGEGIFSQFSFQAIDRSDNASLSFVFDEYDMLIAIVLCVIQNCANFQVVKPELPKSDFPEAALWESFRFMSRSSRSHSYYTQGDTSFPPYPL